MMKEGERFHLGRRGGFHREAGVGEWQDLDRLRGGEREHSKETGWSTGGKIQEVF